ncbi:MIZ/SP-RING zinc finger protein [Xylariales sp. AK1849]|nr:MIZ/SP-RING zinc finger protein [Xylariales sp. AK1849]
MTAWPHGSRKKIMASTNSTREISQLATTLSQLLNKQLQNVCQLNGLKTSGVKAELQKRIINALYESALRDPATYEHIKTSIHNVMQGSTGRGSSHPSNGSSAGSYARGGSAHHISPSPHLHQPVFGQNGFNYSHGQSRGGFGGSPSAIAPQKTALHFKPSPFYAVERMIGDVKTCEVMAQHRNSITVQVKISDTPGMSRCATDKSLRVMVFCAPDDRGVQEIAFPHQSELKVNGGEIKANLRGLKGKTGSTRPVDITDSLRLDKISYVNNIEFTYALTNKKFYFAIFLCKSVGMNDLVAKIKGRKIPKASVIQELTKAAHDPDVVATSQVLSLRCPLSGSRLRAPCRSTSCNHVQCFDATWYLQLQEQGPQWSCPICYKPATFENLAIDEYAKDILDNTTEDTEQVTIEPDGRWKTQASDEPEPKRPRYSNAAAAASILDDDDDDIVPLDDFSVVSSRNTQTPSRSMISTPAPGNGSTSNLNGGTSGSNPRKRTAEVIDLTLSDDDDEPIARAPKRQHTGPTPTPGLSGSSFPPAFQY